MLTPISLNEKTAAATNSDGLKITLLVTLLTHWKGNNDDCVHHSIAPFKLR